LNMLPFWNQKQKRGPPITESHRSTNRGGGGGYKVHHRSPEERESQSHHRTRKRNQKSGGPNKESGGRLFAAKMIKNGNDVGRSPVSAWGGVISRVVELSGGARSGKKQRQTGD